MKRPLVTRDQEIDHCSRSLSLLPSPFSLRRTRLNAAYDDSPSSSSTCWLVFYTLSHPSTALTDIQTSDHIRCARYCDRQIKLNPNDLAPHFLAPSTFVIVHTATVTDRQPSFGLTISTRTRTPTDTRSRVSDQQSLVIQHEYLNIPTITQRHYISPRVWFPLVGKPALSLSSPTHHSLR